MTLHLDDARWRAAIDAELRGDATPAQSELLDDYQPRGTQQRAEAAFLAALAQGPSELDTAKDDPPDWLSAALDTHARSATATGPHGAVQERAAPSRWPLLAAAAAAAAIFLTAGASYFARRGGSEDPRHLEAGRIAPMAPVDPAPADDAPPPEPWQVASGSARLTAPESALRIDQTLSVESALCVERPGHSICADAGSRVTARSSGALALHNGTATVRSEDAEDIRVELDDVTVHAASHSVVVIDHQSAGWSVTVESGTATVTELGVARRLEAGESLQRDLRSATAATPSVKRTLKASTLLARARSQRRDADPRGAMRTYAELIRQHPRSPAAQTARMSLAQLQLDRGSAKDALRSFRAYLKRGGALSEDAAYGEIRALRALDRSSEAKRAAQAFTQRYPGSPYGAKLKR